MAGKRTTIKENAHDPTVDRRPRCESKKKKNERKKSQTKPKSLLPRERCRFAEMSDEFGVFFRFFFQSRLFHDRQKFLHEAPAVASFLIWRTSSVEPFGFSTKSKTESSILQLDLRLVSDEIVEDNSPRRCQPYSSSFKLLESDRFLSQFDFGQDGGRSGSCGGSVSFSFFFSFFFLVIEKKRKNNRTDEKKNSKNAHPLREK